MNKLDTNLLEDKLKSLPEELQELLSSTETANLIFRVGEKNGLSIDQSSTLSQIVASAILGLISSNDLLGTISSELQIDKSTSQIIIDNLRDDVFNKIKNGIRKSQEEREDTPNYISEQVTTTTEPEPPSQTESDIAGVERAGDFEIERTSDTPKPQETDEIPRVEGRDTLINGIENPSRIKDGYYSGNIINNNIKTEPLVDQLLSRNTAIPAENVVRYANDTENVQTGAPQPPANLPTGDPYREKFN